MSIFLGVDTSNYTTSFAMCGDAEKNVRKILDVPDGARGIRQSDGVFRHIKQAPDLFHSLCEGVDMSKVRAVGVSTRPRNREGSYMPVFTAGETFAHMIADSLNVPLKKYSHQDGHIMAGIVSCDDMSLLERNFCAVHLSGGTLELLRVCFNGYDFDAEIVGKTLDISAGQLIDRVGVALGMKFPCGAELDKNALAAKKTALRLAVSVRGGDINFSGAEAQAMRAVGRYTEGELCLAVMECVAKSLAKVITDIGAGEILMTGGVSSSGFLRRRLAELLPEKKLVFAAPEYAADNAAGIANLCRIGMGE